MTETPEDTTVNIMLQLARQNADNLKIIETLKKQLDATYGCESCTGLPTLTNPDVSRAAFKAVFYDKPEYLFDDTPLSNLEKRQAEQIKQLRAALNNLVQFGSSEDVCSVSMKYIKEGRKLLNELNNTSL